MSIDRMSDVWRHSSQSGSDLLLLLALADYADEFGYCWPSIDTLAEKTRMSRATVLRAAARCEDSGELFIEHNRRTGNKYVVIVGLPTGQIIAGLVKHFDLTPSQAEDRVKSLHEKSQNDTNGNKSQSDTSEVSSFATSEVSSVALDPSVTINETSDSAPGGAGTETASHSDETPTTSDADVVAADTVAAGEGTPASEVAGKKRCPRPLMNAILEQIIAQFGYNREALTNKNWSSLRGVASQLGKVGATPDDIPPLYRYVKEVRGPELGFRQFTEQALDKYWPDFTAWRAKKIAVAHSVFTPAEIDAIRDAQFGPMPLQKAG